LPRNHRLGIHHDADCLGLLTCQSTLLTGGTYERTSLSAAAKMISTKWRWFRNGTLTRRA